MWGVLLNSKRHVQFYRVRPRAFLIGGQSLTLCMHEVAYSMQPSLMGIKIVYKVMFDECTAQEDFCDDRGSHLFDISLIFKKQTPLRSSSGKSPDSAYSF